MICEQTENEQRELRTQISRWQRTQRFSSADQFYGHFLRRLPSTPNSLTPSPPSPEIPPMATSLLSPHLPLSSPFYPTLSLCNRLAVTNARIPHRTSLSFPRRRRVHCTSGGTRPEETGLQIYRDIDRLLTDTVKRSQSAAFGVSSDWTEIEGAWVLKPKRSEKPSAVVHFIGGIFVGAAPQLTYRLFLERLAERGNVVIATPYASGFDHFAIADEVQFKFDRCLRHFHDSVSEVPSFGIGHSLGSVIHLLIGSRFAVQRSGNVLMAFNNKESSLAIPLFSSVVAPMAQSIGPILSQIASYPSVRLGTEMTLKQLENLSPSIVKQVLPLVEQLPSLYMELANGRENFSPAPEETQRLVKSYYGVMRNLLVKFEDDTLDETPRLAQVLSVESAISTMLDLSIRTLPGDHVLPLQQGLPDVPPAVADAVNRGSEILANLTVGTPWESVARDVGSTFGLDSRVLRTQNLKDLNNLVDVITSWMASNAGSKLLKP
ncbi:hypothetical protein Dimus_010424 [Dionaea muscipula]